MNTWSDGVPITKEQLALLAKFLGFESLVDTNLPPSAEYPNGIKSHHHWRIGLDGGIVGVNDVDYSDGDLLLDILTKAAEKDYNSYFAILTTLMDCFSIADPALRIRAVIQTTLRIAVA